MLFIWALIANFGAKHQHLGINGTNTIGLFMVNEVISIAKHLIKKIYKKLIK